MEGEGEHRRFTVDGTAYMRSLSRDDLNQRWIAIHYQDPPIEKGDGRRTIHMRFPILVVAQYVEEREDIAQKVAHILNEHWSDEDEANAT